MITLSVHLITYNSENYIEETLQSILKQKVDFEWEIVVGDDCSTDKTFEIIKTYETQYPNLFNVKKNDTQLGILGNYKTTLDRCKGTYVFDIAGDDLLKGDDALQKMVTVLKSDSTLGFIDCGFDEYVENINVTNTFKNKKILFADKEVYKKTFLLGQMSSHGMCFNRESLYKYVDFDSYIEQNISIEDYPIIVDLIMNTNFLTIKESLHIYRVHNQSYSNQKNFEHLLTQRKQMKQLFDYFSDKYGFDKVLIEEFYTNYHKGLLFLAGYYEQKELGKQSFRNLDSKSLNDWVYYCCSQLPVLKRVLLVSRRKATRILKQIR